MIKEIAFDKEVILHLIKKNNYTIYLSSLQKITNRDLIAKFLANFRDIYAY